MTTPFPPGMGEWGRRQERRIAALERRTTNSASTPSLRPVLVSNGQGTITSPSGTPSINWVSVNTADQVSVRVLTSSGLIRYTLSATVSAERTGTLYGASDSSMAITLQNPTSELALADPTRNALRRSFRFQGGVPDTFQAYSVSITGVLRFDPGDYTLYTGYSYQHTTSNIAVAWSDRVIIAEAI